MCEIMEQMREEAFEHGVERGLERGEELTLLECVRRMAHELDMTFERALEVLGVPRADWSRYLSML